MSRTLIAIGLCIVVVGLLWPWLSKLPFGQLPGDITIRRENFSFYFPLTTMILISVLLSALLWLFNR
ncbi:DUF2905 domain-containing protein [Billgrantia kenyensis]|uniref:DUF2905 domain-containing protein n=1 Tax=Billgrantia kenyensis TaxID=321266 RepID=A0A7W0ADQ2_9GAMM|nr:DUF2905 domain-containing protein [Halomonas kenyensis]MBA2779288.1 DUF2905 domain-containing protein [Halomonas kenyensis]MCG6660928.1 DUF2905 domain-containing protein [Halomonas kenyensis]